MSHLPSELKYAATHEWVRVENTDEVVVGITEHAQDLLGDVVFVELPSLGSRLLAEDECAQVESVKAASDIYAPVSGEVIAINNELEDSPELINSDPYGEGWLFRIKLSNAFGFDSLLTATEYQNNIED
ncbi:MAG: glycine cleavage system protein GcvH [Oceanisphaera sp.]|uniref:glycine cleavage system protein GcvH n=1 Tax=Oceanisphaera sp. TaxID=1929979 RepID=UPI003F9AF894